MTNKWTTIVLAGIIILHLFLLSKTTFFPYPELFVYSYLTKAGLIPYKDIFDQHFPGLVFFPINLATLGIDTVYSFRIVQLLMVAITQVLLFLVSKKIFKSNILSLLTCILYLLWQPFFEGYVMWIDSFVPPLLLGAYYFLSIRDKKWNLFWTGFLLGLSLLLKQVIGPLIIVITIYLLWKEKSVKKILPYAIGVLIPVTYLLFWVTHLGIWNDFWYWTVTFNTTIFAKMGRTYPSVGQVMRMGPVFGVAIAGILTFFIARRETTWQSPRLTRLPRFARNDNQILLSLFFLGSLLFAYARFDYVHLQPALPFAILILTYGAKYILDTKAWKYYWIPAYAVMTIYLLVPFYRSNWDGGVRFNGDFEQRVSQKVLEYANPGDSTFALGTTPHLYYLTGTLPPGRVFVFQFPWFMLQAGEKILDGIKKDPPKVVVRDRTAEVQDMKLVDFMPNIDTYIEVNYQVVDNVDGTEIMVPR